MLIHELDFQGQMLEDGLCINISFRSQEYTPIIRGQNFLRFGLYEPILIDERQEWIQRIEESVKPDIIKEIEQLLEFPTEELMKQVNFVPPRLRKNTQASP
jgi:hypothetical protein